MYYDGPKLVIILLTLIFFISVYGLYYLLFVKQLPIFYSKNNILYHELPRYARLIFYLVAVNLILAILSMYLLIYYANKPQGKAIITNNKEIINEIRSTQKNIIKSINGIKINDYSKNFQEIGGKLKKIEKEQKEIINKINAIKPSVGPGGIRITFPKGLTNCIYILMVGIGLIIISNSLKLFVSISPKVTGIIKIIGNLTIIGSLAFTLKIAPEIKITNKKSEPPKVNKEYELSKTRMQHLGDVGPFLPCDDKIPLNSGIEKIVDEIKIKLNSHEELCHMIIIGNADWRPLRRQCRDRHVSNNELAQSRAEAVKARIESLGIDPSKIIILMKRPKYLGPFVPSAKMEKDRCVDVYAFWTRWQSEKK